MKILFIAPSNSIHSKKWIEFFCNSNEVIWLSFYKKNIEINKEIKYIEITNLISLIKNIKLLSNLLNYSEIIHQHYIGKYSWIMIFFNLRKYYISPWGSDIKFPKFLSIRGFLIRKLFKKAKIITVDAKYMFDHVNKFGNYKIKTRRINFGTDTSFFSFRNSLVENKNKFKIISLRNLEKIYCINDIIEAIDLINPKIKKTLYVDIFGDGSIKNELQNLVKKKKLEKIVKFKGSYDYLKLPEILKNYDLYISSSSSDAGLAASTSEAMSCGITVLSSDNSENKYWLNDCGFLYKTSDIKDLKNKIELIRSLDSDLIKNKKILARNKIVNENDFSNEMKKMNKLYNEE